MQYPPSVPMGNSNFQTADDMKGEEQHTFTQSLN